jgi:hypothetical protein
MQPQRDRIVSGQRQNADFSDLRRFGFVVLLGLIALAGMIMRNTVILVDQIDRDIAAGQARHQAIIVATILTLLVAPATGCECLG